MSFKKLSRIISTVVILLVVAVGTTFLHVSTNQVKTTLEPRNASVWGSSYAVGDEWPMDGGALNHTGALLQPPNPLSDLIGIQFLQILVTLEIL